MEKFQTDPNVDNYVGLSNNGSVFGQSFLGSVCGNLNIRVVNVMAGTWGDFATATVRIRPHSTSSKGREKSRGGPMTGGTHVIYSNVKPDCCFCAEIF